MSTLGPPFFTGPCQRRQMPGKANSGRGCSPLSANQCQVAGLRPSCGSQKEDAGTRQRRVANESLQKPLLTLSSRVLVTRFGARPSCSRTKPQESSEISRSPSSTLRTTGAVAREDLLQRIDRRNSILRHAEEAAVRVAVHGPAGDIADLAVPPL